MSIISRSYVPSQDFDLVMNFLRQTYLETKSIQNWFPDRFEVSSHIDFKSDIRIWEEIYEGGNNTKKIVALANPEQPFRYFIQIHPTYNFLEREIVEWIETHCLSKKRTKIQAQKLVVITVEGNAVRNQLLYIGGAADTPSVNRLYETTGFTKKRNMHVWYKML